MIFSPVTVENAVDTGVGTHVDILALGHLLLPPPRVLKPINSRGGRRRKEERRNGGGCHFRGGVSVSWRGIKCGGGGHWMVKEKEEEG